MNLIAGLYLSLVLLFPILLALARVTEDGNGYGN